jgi:hypothetical protein
MKRYFRHISDALRGKVTVCLTIILLLSPVSASVICIAPGGHIAIEDVNAACCASTGISDQNEKSPENGLATAVDCINCTDFFITPNERGAFLVSYANAVPNSLASACVRNHTPGEISSSQRQSVTINKLDAQSAVTASSPLRC